MTLKEQIEKEIQIWHDYYNNNLKRVQEAESSIIELAEMLDGLTVPPECSSSYNSISITFPSIVEARDYLSQVIQKTLIDNFIKISTPRSDRLDWGYHVEYGKASLTIYPAEPNKDCVAVKKTDTYTSWVCEQKKE